MSKVNYIAVFLFSMCSINYAHSQNQPVPDKIEQHFELLYPKAINTLWQDQPANNTTRQVSFDCNCTEGSGHLRVTFDANGNIVTKLVVILKKDLPGTATDYIDNNYPNNAFAYGEVAKVTNAGEDLIYRVALLQMNPDGTITDGSWVYVLKFKASGEFISMEKRLQNN